MKKIITLAFALFLCLQAVALQNWKSYTNITHMYDALQDGSTIYCCTWGGLVCYNSYETTTQSVESVLTIGNGLDDSNIRAIASRENTLFLGTERKGVIILQDGVSRIPLNTTVGLPSNRVNSIALNDSVTVVATNSGVSVFKSNPAYPFPLLITTFDVDNGLVTNKVTKVLINADEYLFVQTSEAVQFIHLSQLSAQNAWHTITVADAGVNTFQDAAVYGGLVYLATDAGIFLAEDIYQTPQISHLIETDPIYPIAVDGEGNVWFSYGSWIEANLALENLGQYALAKYSQSGSLTRWLPGELIESQKVKKISFFGNRVFVSTWGDGAYILDDEELAFAIKPNCIQANLVRDMEFDANNRLWIANGFLPPPGMPTIPKGTKGVSSYDGDVWQNYSTEDSPLVSNNIYDVHIDANNNKVFGSWSAGASVFNDASNTWLTINSASNDSMETNACVAFTTSNSGDLLMANYATKVIVMDEDYENLSTFRLYQPNGDYKFTDVLQMYTTPTRTVLGCRYNGIRIWDDASVPLQDGTHWVVPPFTDLKSAEIYDITSRQTGYGEELWIAASTGLYMYGYNRYFQTDMWHLYGTDIKKQVWNNGWYYEEGSPEYLYVVGQEKLFGSVPTNPSALQIDPFNRVWVGSASNGFTIFTPEKDTYENYNTSKVPLLSNIITSFAYDAVTGEMYIGTPNGLNTVQVGLTEEQNTETKLYDVIAFPNPFKPTEDGVLRIENHGAISMPKDKTQCKIYDISGDLIVVLDKDQYQQFSWDGTNKAGKVCSSGMYYWVVGSPKGEIAKGKIALIR